MCFPKCKQCDEEIKAVHGEEDPFAEEVGPNTNANECFIPKDIPEHIDSVNLNFSVEDGIFCLVYETSHQIIYVCTSEDAMMVYNALYELEFP